MAPLNPNASEFVPSTSPGSCDVSPLEFWNGFNTQADAEVNMTEEELEEIEACEEWVRQMVELDDMEREHLIALALNQAPREKVMEIELRHELVAF